MVTGGGTGGHVYPALAVVDELSSNGIWRTSRNEIAWVGVAGNIEQEIIQRAGLRFYAVSSGALRGANPLQALSSIAHLVQGRRQAFGFIREFKPEVVLATGGYVSAPLVLAAHKSRVPVLILLPDIEPGMAVRYLARMAQKVTVSFPEVARYFQPGKVLVTGYPVRPVLFSLTKYQARAELQLHPEGTVLLVLGGSRGARSINNAVSAMLPKILPLADIVHLCGREDYPALQEQRKALPHTQQARYQLYPYLHDQMPAALAAADLVVARAGAATLAEFPAVGLPAILVPYPFAGRHQQMNADFMASHGAGLVLADDALAEHLEPTVLDLLQDASRLREMSRAARAMAMPHAAHAVAEALQNLAKGGKDAR
ncbi:MAG: undecaprenyldiphospho-muramoylpentapeptide beta-N-acetylglucosaminyltransferase [Chloroflexi bacterium]|nr:undecaprenyldiphospho-muramoylpentapeptide beta-N-acetylglucosaminyltransferase [Chloroflexota bacterium]